MHTASSRTKRCAALVVAFGLFAQGCGSAAASTPDARHVVQQLKAAGVPISTVKVYTPANDTNLLLGRPGQYTSKANFHDRRLRASQLFPGFSVDNGGSVEAFASTTAARRRYRYVYAITQAAPIFAEYDYLDGRVLLRLSHRLTPAQAHQYFAALKRS